MGDGNEINIKKTQKSDKKKKIQGAEFELFPHLTSSVHFNSLCFTFIKKHIIFLH